MSRPRVVWVNGTLEPAEKALLSVTDRSFQLGDGVFETLRVVGGGVLELSVHASRLKATALFLVEGMGLATPSLDCGEDVASGTS
ncbi:MAG: hypothetical protein ACLP36_09715 [Acidimicrobiales bacterium]|jgi:branched-chain amino acid aminotransferase